MVVKNKNFALPLVLALAACVIYINSNNLIFLAALIAISGAFLVFCEPKIGLFAAILLYPFLPDALSIVLFLGLGFLVFFRKLIFKEEAFFKSIYGFIISIYLIIAIINTITSIDAKGSIRDLGLLISGISFFFAFVNTIKSREEFNAFIITMLISAVFASLIGVYQYFNGAELLPEWVDTENSTDIRVRVYSVFLNPNIFAEYLEFMIPLAVAISWQTKNLKKKIFFCLGTLILFIALFMTLSRGGMVGIFVAALVFVLLVDKRLVLLAIPFGLLALIFLPQSILSRITSITNISDTSNSYRLEIWEIVLKIIRDNPLVGVGYGYIPFREAFGRYTRLIAIFHAHNTYLEILAEIGILGMSVFLMILYMPLRKLAELRKSDSYTRIIAAGLFASISAVFTHAVFEHILYMPRLVFTFWIFMAIATKLISLSDKEHCEG